MTTVPTATTRINAMRGRDFSCRGHPWNNIFVCHFVVAFTDASVAGSVGVSVNKQTIYLKNMALTVKYTLQ